VFGTKGFRKRVNRVQPRSSVTENVYRGVVFDGVCTDLSNAAYPVERVRARVEPRFPECPDTAIHLALTLLHHGYVRETEDGFELSDTGETAIEEGALVDLFCEDADVRPRDERALARFATLVTGVAEAIVGDSPEDVS